jgi:hypothetical protein
MAMVWGGCVVDEGCGSRGGPGVLGFARVVMLIFGGLAQDLCSSHVRRLHSSAAAGKAVAQATNRGVVVGEPGHSGRLASRSGQYQREVCQRELVGLL